MNLNIKYLIIFDKTILHISKFTFLFKKIAVLVCNLETSSVEFGHGMHHLYSDYILSADKVLCSWIIQAI